MKRHGGIRWTSILLLAMGCVDGSLRSGADGSVDLSGGAFIDAASEMGGAVPGVCGTSLPTVGATEVTTVIAALAACPAWPNGKLFPEIGPFFYGPDPGPCTYKRVSLAADNNTFLTLSYGYSTEGLLTEYVNAWPAERYFPVWRDGRLVQITGMDDTLKTTTIAAYEWKDGAAIETLKATVNRYALAPNGYPLSVVTTSLTDPSYCQVGLFDYEACRLIAMRLMVAGNPASAKEWAVAYAYDDRDHLISRTDVGRAIADTYDYGCWK